jgi:hypothetical protein
VEETGYPLQSSHVVAQRRDDHRFCLGPAGCLPKLRLPFHPSTAPVKITSATGIAKQPYISHLYDNGQKERSIEDHLETHITSAGIQEIADGR